MTPDLRRFSWHTGAPLRPISPDEELLPLFRDVGPEALATFLGGSLTRLAGPLSPLLYARSAEFVEPYTDHEQTGRLLILNPRELGFWHSGVPEVFVASAHVPANWEAIAFVPGTTDQLRFAREASMMSSRDEVREALGGRDYDAMRAVERERMRELCADLEHSEHWARPLRSVLQSGSSAQRLRVREALAARQLSEDDLCTAWHHLPRVRRALLKESLPSLVEEAGVPCPA